MKVESGEELNSIRILKFLPISLVSIIEGMAQAYREFSHKIAMTIYFYKANHISTIVTDEFGNEVFSVDSDQRSTEDILMNNNKLAFKNLR